MFDPFVSRQADGRFLATSDIQQRFPALPVSCSSKQSSQMNHIRPYLKVKTEITFGKGAGIIVIKANRGM